MSNPNPKTEHLEEYKWKPGTSGNPNGPPVGNKHLATWIQEMLNQEIDFKILTEGTGKNKVYKSYKGIPIQAIIAVAIHQSMLGHKDARDWLAKYGYGSKLKIETEDPIDKILEQLGLKGNSDAGQDSGSQS